jgi:putative PIN family toxin of toxin-antitoxin system
MLLAVIDTNVVVSGLVARREESPNRHIVSALLRGRLRFVISEALLVEYRRVLLDPRIVARHGLTEVEVDSLLTGLVVNAVIREPSAASDPAGGGDEHIVALVRAVPGAVLVTGDRRLAEEVKLWCSVFTPAEFAADNL